MSHKNQGPNWTVIAVGLLPLDAAVIKSRLESESIPVLLNKESIGSVIGLTVGPLGVASVWVPEKFAQTASEIIELTDEDNP